MPVSPLRLIATDYRQRKKTWPDTYLLLYSGGHMPETEAEQKKVMEAWTPWFGKHGEAITDGGNPFTANLAPPISTGQPFAISTALSSESA